MIRLCETVHTGGCWQSILRTGCKLGPTPVDLGFLHWNESNFGYSVMLHMLLVIYLVRLMVFGSHDEDSSTRSVAYCTTVQTIEIYCSSVVILVERRSNL